MAEEVGLTLGILLGIVFRDTHFQGRQLLATCSAVNQLYALDANWRPFVRCVELHSIL